MAEVTSIRWWESRLAGRLHLLVALAVLSLLIRLALQEDLTWLAGAVLGLIVCILTATWWPYGALFVVVAMSAMPVYFVELFGWKARPEHFAAAVVLAAVCISLLFSKRALQPDRLDYWVLAFVAVNFVSSAFGSSEPASTLRWALQNSFAILPYFLIRFLISDLETLRKAFRILLAVELAESAFGILCYASHQIFGTTVGISIGQYLVDVSAPYGSMYEANLFGAYTACGAVLFLVLYRVGRHRIISFSGFLIASLATVLSYSRAALLALVVVTIWVFWKTRHAKGSGSKVLVSLLAFTLVFVIGVYAVGGVLQERFANLYYNGLTEETAISRALVIQEALQEIPSHPILGSGTASFNLSFDWNRYIPEWASDKTWIGNAPLRILHDTGLVGLAIFLGFFVSAWWKSRSTPPAVPDGMLLSLVAGAFVYGITFEFTDGSSLAFFWVQLGFLASTVILPRNLPGASSNTPSTLK
jgi:O-antigen ligase